MVGRGGHKPQAFVYTPFHVPGTALKAVNKWLADNGLTSPGSPPPFPSSTFLPPSIADLAGAPDAKKVQLLRADLIRQLGWSAWQSYEESWVVLRFPNEFAQF